MISLLDHPSISGKYLFPQNRKLKRPFVVRVNNVELACFQRIVDNSGLTLIHFHGNGEAVVDYIPFMADVFEDMGLNQLFVEYRAYGGSSGEAKLVAMLADGARSCKLPELANPTSRPRLPSTSITNRNYRATPIRC
jgi:hypothetical protein